MAAKTERKSFLLKPIDGRCSAVNRGVTRVFIRADLPQRQIAGVKVIPFPVEAEKAVAFLRQEGI